MKARAMKARAMKARAMKTRAMEAENGIAANGARIANRAGLMHVFDISPRSWVYDGLVMAR
jgi:hypothetical protein